MIRQSSAYTYNETKKINLKIKVPYKFKVIRKRQAPSPLGMNALILRISDASNSKQSAPALSISIITSRSERSPRLTCI